MSKIMALMEAEARASRNGLRPSLFTFKEGGKWEVWYWGPVQLSELEQRHPTAVQIDGRTVHSMSFMEEPAAPMERWDCINGWTPPIHEMLSGQRWDGKKWR